MIYVGLEFLTLFAQHRLDLINVPLGMLQIPLERNVMEDLNVQICPFQILAQVLALLWLQLRAYQAINLMDHLYGQSNEAQISEDIVVYLICPDGLVVLRVDQQLLDPIP